MLNLTITPGCVDAELFYVIGYGMRINRDDRSMSYVIENNKH